MHISISIQTAPRVSISPAVHTFMPSERVANFSCMPSNPDIPVYWTRSDNPGAIASRNRNYVFTVSSQDLDILEGVSFNCFVTNPGPPSSSPDQVPVAMASSVFRNTNGELIQYVAKKSLRSLQVASGILHIAHNYVAAVGASSSPGKAFLKSYLIRIIISMSCSVSCIYNEQAVADPGGDPMQGATDPPFQAIAMWL